MDNVTNEQRDLIKKASTERLRVKLLQGGMSEDEVFALDRKPLMEAVAELMLQQADVVTDGGNISDRTGEMKSLKERELELQAMELEMRRSEFDAAERRFQAEMSLRHAEIRRQERVDEERRESDNSLVTRTKKFSEAVKNVFVKMTNDPA